MNTRTLSTLFVIAIVAMIGLAGCYTQLMPFREAVEIRKMSKASEHNPRGMAAASGADLNYSNDCLTCHSQAELNDRAFDMDRAGLISVHGGAYDPYGWQSPYTQPPWWDPYPTISIAPGGPGQTPVILTGSGSNTDAQKNSTRARKAPSAAERQNSTRTRTTPATTASPAPTTPATPTTPTGTYTPPVISTPSTPSNPPPSSPPADTRSRSGSGSEGTPTRKSGSGR
ncbi:MAG TPA: hypothetical protein VK470_06180 [Bacteroidota bacterium]|nr:hypothetical protein [Bacteroidota bacterium]